MGIRFVRPQTDSTLEFLFKKARLPNRVALINWLKLVISTFTDGSYYVSEGEGGSIAVCTNSGVPIAVWR